MNQISEIWNVIVRLIVLSYFHRIMLALGLCVDALYSVYLKFAVPRPDRAENLPLEQKKRPGISLVAIGVAVIYPGVAGAGGRLAHSRQEV